MPDVDVSYGSMGSEDVSQSSDLQQNQMIVARLKAP